MLLNVVDSMGTGQYKYVLSPVQGHSKETKSSATTWPTLGREPHSFERQEVTIYRAPIIYLESSCFICILDPMVSA